MIVKSNDVIVVLLKEGIGCLILFECFVLKDVLMILLNFYWYFYFI